MTSQMERVQRHLRRWLSHALSSDRANILASVHHRLQVLHVEHLFENLRFQDRVLMLDLCLGTRDLLMHRLLLQVALKRRLHLF